jgi:hypothetical protein
MTNTELQAILDGHAWIRVKKYDPIDGSSAEELLLKLERHHQEETTFLIEKCRELAAELLKVQR